MAGFGLGQLQACAARAPPIQTVGDPGTERVPVMRMTNSVLRMSPLRLTPWGGLDSPAQLKREV